MHPRESSFDDPKKVVAEGFAAAGAQLAHAPRLGPAGETDDWQRQVPGSAGKSQATWIGFTVAGTAPESHRLPF